MGRRMHAGDVDSTMMPGPAFNITLYGSGHFNAGNVALLSIYKTKSSENWAN